MIYCRFERYERALVKGHKQRLDLHESKENLDIDMHVCKSQVMQLMQEGYKLRLIEQKYYCNRTNTRLLIS